VTLFGRANESGAQVENTRDHDDIGRVNRSTSVLHVHNLTVSEAQTVGQLLLGHIRVVPRCANNRDDRTVQPLAFLVLCGLPLLKLHARPRNFGGRTIYTATSLIG
jgi:hypothetical protein